MEMLNAHTRYFEIQYTINFGTFFFGFGAFNKK